MAFRIRHMLFGLIIVVAGILLPRAADAAPLEGSPVLHQSSLSLHRIAPQAPLVFEVNRGQADGRIRFLAHGPGYTLSATRRGIALVYATGHSHQVGHASSVLQLLPAGMSARVQLIGVNRLPGRVNYFFGNDPRQWKTNVPAYAGIEYRNIYPGIDLRFYERSGNLEYDWVLRPGASPSHIALKLGGASHLELDSRGNLTIHISRALIRQQRPTIYQVVGGRRQHISGGFSLTRDGRVGIHIGMYDRSKMLVVDPTLFYSSYLGGSGDDLASGVATDGAGNAYVTGNTTSRGAYPAGFPTKTPYQSLNASQVPYYVEDVFISKINTNSSGAASLVYSTYLGGSNDDTASGIAIDRNGNAYIAGSTDSNGSSPTPFPVVNAYQPQNAGGGRYDAFLAKLSSAGSALLYSTYFGGEADDFGGHLAVDAAGNAYLVGTTSSLASQGFPLKNAFQSGNLGGTSDAFVARFNPSSSGAASLIYSTFLGGFGADTGASIAVDGSGNAYVTGSTSSICTPATTPCPDPFPVRNGFQSASSNASGSDTNAFVAKLNTNSSGTASLLYSSCLGGTGSDAGYGIAQDGVGRAFITGSTSSSGAAPAGFPTKNAYQSANAGGTDAFLTVADTTATGAASLVYSTYLGGSGSDTGYGVAVDAADRAFLTGDTTSAGASPNGFPTVAALQGSNNGASDMFVALLATTTPGSGGLTFSSYGGGSGDDGGRGIAIDSSGNIFVAGFTASSGSYPAGFPTQNAFQAVSNGGYDGFLARITTNSVVSVSVSPIFGPATTTVHLTGTGFTPGETVSVYWNCSAYPCSGGVNEGTATASGSGAVSKAVSVPIITTAGTYSIAAHGQSSGITATATFTVAPMASSWAAGTPNPAPASYLAGAAMRDGRIIVLGGYGSSGTPTTTATALSAVGTVWTALAPMRVSRASFAAATGSDGKTYAFGGYTGGATTAPVTSSIEAYDPSTNTWSSAGSLRTARYEESAVAGHNGVIYVLGGIDTSGTTLNSVEAYTPGTSFPMYVSPMPTARSGFAAAVGSDGRIYAIGGRDAGGADLRTVEAYNPATDTWVTLASIPTACHHCTAAPGPDGRIYVTGGNAGRLVQVFNPRSNSWTTAPSTLSTHDGGITVATVNDRVYAIGGDGSESSNEYLVITPVRAVSAWSVVPNLPQPLNFLASTTGRDGRVYALGGYGAGGAPVAQAEVYAPGAGGWTSLTPMQLPRAALAAATGADGRIYAIGGDTGSTVTATVEAYSPTSGTWSYAGSLQTARYAAAAAYGRTTGNIYVFGGRDANDVTLSSVEMYNPALGAWSYVAPMPTPRSGVAAVAGMDGRIYVMGGRDAAGNVLGTVEVYDPARNAWSSAASMPTPRRYLGAAIDNFGRIYAIDGLSNSSSAAGATGAGQAEMPINGSGRISRSDPSVTSSTPLSKVEVFSPASNTWVAGLSTIYSRYGLAATTGSDGRIYAIGADGSGQRAEAYNPS